MNNKDHLVGQLTIVPVAVDISTQVAAECPFLIMPCPCAHLADVQVCMFSKDDDVHQVVLENSYSMLEVTRQTVNHLPFQAKQLAD